MKYDDVIVKEIQTGREYDDTLTLMVEEFPDHKDTALNTYKRVYTRQEEQIITVSDVAVSIPIIEQMENTIRAREARRNKGK